MEIKISDKNGLNIKYEIKEKNEKYIFTKFEEINNEYEESEEYTEQIKNKRQYKKFMKKLNKLLNKSF